MNSFITVLTSSNGMPCQVLFLQEGAGSGEGGPATLSAGTSSTYSLFQQK